MKPVKTVAALPWANALFFLVAILMCISGHAQNPGGVAGSRLWLRADALASTTADNTAISAWNDQSGSANHVAQANASNQPAYRKASDQLINFNPVLRFDGNSDMLTDADGLFGTATFTNTAAFTVSAASNVQNGSVFHEMVSGSNMFYNMHLPWGDGLAYWDGAFNRRVAIAQGSWLNTPVLWTGRSNNNLSPPTVLRRNGFNIGTNNLSNSFTGNNSTLYIGRESPAMSAGLNNFYAGRIGEVIIFTAALTQAETWRVESYLSLKYGLSITNDYLSSSGATIWSVNSNGLYANDRAGIGRDDATSLHQRQSQSVNGGVQPLIALGTIAATNSDNLNNFSADQSFLLWGASPHAADFLNPVSLGNLNFLMQRSWRVQESGTVGDVLVALPASTFPNLQQPTLVVSSSSTFASGNTLVPLTLTTYNGQSFYTGTVNFTSGQYFTFGARIVAPGNVQGATLWLRADKIQSASGTAVGTWDDQSGMGNTVSQVQANQQPTFRQSTSENINFNPVLQFDGVNDGLSDGSGILGTSSYSSMAAFSVGAASAVQNGHLFSENLASGAFTLRAPAGDGNAYWDAPAGSRVSIAWGGTLGQPHLWTGWNNSSLNPRNVLRRDGNVLGSNFTSGSVSGANSPLFVGTDATGAFYAGKMGELIIYPSALSQMQRLQVETYLAIKYGVTFGDSYVSSNGVVIWDRVIYATHRNHMAGIGRDDVSELHQRQSQSVNSGLQPLISLGTPAASNAANTNNFSADRSYLIWGSDLANTDFSPGFFRTGISWRMNRTWRVAEFGTVGSVQVAIPTALLPALSSLNLVVSGSQTFNDALIVIPMTATTINGASYLTASIDFTSGQFFTFGNADLGPGGVPGAAVWLRPESVAVPDNTPFSQWNDLAGQANHVVQATTTRQPLFRNSLTENINFNPVIRFDGIDDGFIDFGGILGTGTYSHAAAFALTATGAIQNNYLFQELVSGGGSIGMQVLSDAGSAVWDGPDSKRLSVSWGGVVNTPYLWSGWNNGTLTPQNVLRRNGNMIANSSTSGSYTGFNSTFYVGQAQGSTGFFSGRSGDIAVYTRALSATERQRVESYFSLKYGLTYTESLLSSNGTVIWDLSAAGAFKADVAGIGRDDRSMLHQRQGQSTNSGAQPVLALGTIAASSPNNPNNFSADQSFLVWSSDNAAASFSTGFGFGQVNYRMQRIWRVQETGTVGSVLVALPASYFPSSLNPTLLLSNTSTMDATSTRLPLTLANHNGINYYEATVDFSGVQFFTFACFSAAPGGVSGASIWLRGDGQSGADNTGIASWADQSGTGNTVVQATSANQPAFRTDPAQTVNFNPVVRFSGSQWMTDANGLMGANSYSHSAAFVLSVSETTGSTSLFHEALATGGFFNMHVPWSDGNIYWDGPFGRRVFTSMSGSQNVPVLWTGWNNSNLSPQNTLRRNGSQIASATTVGSYVGNGSTFNLGRESNGNNRFVGRLGELIIYTSALSATQRQQVESYLALKYGIPLSGDYLNSGGTTIWSATTNSGYTSNMAGIGRDNASALHQRQSQSTNSGVQPVLALGTIAATNPDNTNSFAADNSFLIWGSDAGTTTFSTGYPFGSVNRRFGRVWRVQETGTVGTVLVALPAASFPNLQQPSLLVSNSAVFDEASSRISLTPTTINNVSYYIGSVDFSTGQYFTFACFNASPGGVPGSVLWLRPEAIGAADNTAVAAWTDQSGTGNHVSQAVAGNQPIYRQAATENINFNAVVQFSGNQWMIDGNGILGTGTYSNAAAFAVSALSNLQNTSLFHELLGSGNFFNMHAPWSDGNVYWDGAYNRRVAGAWGGALNVPFLWTGWNNNSLSPQNSLRRNGTQIASGTQTLSYTGNNSALHLGQESYGSSRYAGRIGELIIYNTALSATQRQQVESYLAIKYGLPLLGDYLNSAGTTIWNSTVNAGFNNDVTAIGRDDASALHQRQSQSVNPGLQPAIAVGGLYPSNPESLKSFGADLSFLFWGSDGGAFTFSTDYEFADLTRRITRLWRVQESGSVANVQVALPASAFPNLINPMLLVSNTNSFDETATRMPLTLLTVNGVNYYTTLVNFNSGQYFTFACFNGAPGGVAGASLWVRPDALSGSDGSAVANWADQSGSANHLSQIAVTARPLYRQNLTDNVNFHPVVRFDGSNDALTDASGITGVGTYAHSAAFAVSVNENVQNSYLFHEGLANSHSLGLQVPSADGSAYWDGASNSRLQAAWGGQVSRPQLWTGWNNGNLSPQSNFFRNGTLLASGNQAAYSGAGSPFSLGQMNGALNFYNGKVAELALYTTALSAVERQRVESYFALKYGLHLPGDYISSAGATVWSTASNAGYTQNVAGIGRDNASALYQRQSQSRQPGLQPVLAIGTIAASNALNTNKFTADQSFLIWGSDAGMAGFRTPFTEGGLSHRVSRIWRVQESGTVGSVLVGFPADSFPSLNSPTLLVSNTSTFDAAATRITMSRTTYPAGTFYTASVDLANGQYFTFAGLLRYAPGGVSGAALWLRADAVERTNPDNTAVAALLDQSFSGNNVSQALSANRPAYRRSLTENLNFNPVLRFDGNGDALVDANGILGEETFSNAAFFAVSALAQLQHTTLIHERLAGGHQLNFNAPLADGTLNWDGASNSRLSASWGGSLNVPYLWTGWSNGSLTPQNTLRRNGTLLASGAYGGSFTAQSAAFHVGQESGGTQSYAGRVGEIVVFPAALSVAQRQQVESYLAIKYGLTIPGDYLNTQGTVIWNATTNNGFNSNIAGIGRDDATVLDQKQSQSTNPGTQPVVAMGSIAASNPQNTNLFSTDRSFLIWGSDNGSTDFNTPVSLPGLSVRMQRIWRVQETGTVGNVLIALPAAAFPNMITVNLIVNNVPSFESSGSRTVMTRITINGIEYYTATVDILSTQYFTFGALPAAPGGVSGAALWLRADGIALSTADQAALASWQDESGSSNTVSQGNTAQQPSYRKRGSQIINFNPSVRFDGGNDALVDATGILGTLSYTGASAFSVAVTENVQSSYLFHEGAAGGLLFAMSIPWSNGSTFWEGASNRQLSAPWGGVTNTPYLWSGWNNNSLSPANNLRRNGTTISTHAITATYQGGNGSFHLGQMNSGISYLAGRVGELAIYTSTLVSATQRQQIESYLAIKYGLTIPGDYLNTAGSIIWNATTNAGYLSDVTGIGRDDFTALHQRQSQSVNSGLQPVLALGTIAATSPENTNNLTADRSYLIWGHNAASVLFNTAFSFGGLTQRMARIWRVQESGTVGDVLVALPAAELPLFQQASLLVSSTTTFDGAATRVPMTRTTLDGVSYYTASVNFATGHYFTFACSTPAPGGVSGAALWLKADALAGTPDNTGVATWVDQTLLQNTVSQATAGNQPAYRSSSTEQFNFNPVLRFAGSQWLTDANGILGTGTYSNAAAFAVSALSNLQNTSLFHELLATGNFFNMHAPWSDGNVYWDGAYNRRVAGPWGGTLNVPILWAGWNNNSLSPQSSLRRNGTQIASGTQTLSYTGNNSPLHVGQESYGSSRYAGRIGELIIYNTALSATQRQQVESYLAIKYGLPLAGDYLNAAGTVVWNATAGAGYGNNIAGIGRDDASALYQRQSRSSNTGAGGMLTAWLGSGGLPASNLQNSEVMPNNRFLIWGDNGASADASVAARLTTNLPANLACLSRLGRQWRLQATGGSTTASIMIDFAGLNLPVGTLASDVRLLVYRKGTSGSWDTGDAWQLYQAQGSGVISGTTLSFPNVAIDTDGDGADFLYVIFDAIRREAPPAVATTTTTAQPSACRDTSGFIQFVDNITTPTAKYIAILPTNGSLGAGSVTVNAGTTLTGATAGTGSGRVQLRSSGGTGTAYATALLQRMIIIPASMANGGTFTVRIYFHPSDTVSANNAALTTARQLDATAALRGGGWYKYQNDDPGGAAVAAAQSAGSAGFTTGNFQWLTNGSFGSENGISYVDFAGITSFSTFGYMAGAGSPGGHSLPLRLLRFDLHEEDCVPKLSWKTVEEEQVDYFAVEASTNGTQFTELGRIPATNNPAGATYHYPARNRGTEQRLFRLRMVDIGGAYTFSSILRYQPAPRCFQAQSVRVFPNPVAAQETLIVSGLRPGYRVVVRSVGGQQLREERVLSDRLYLKLQEYASGVFLLEIRDMSGQVIKSERIVRMP